ncbi:MAG: nucleotidyltransferase family protein [Bacteroidales bacterium]|nr:nucleotidyltransferase family protein [Bacteroidales bacterium]
MNEISAIILAAGESKRMGQPKMLLDIGGKSMIGRVVENVAGSDVGEIIVVLGAYSIEIRAELENSGVRFAVNEAYGDGMLSSVRCGIAALPELSRACLVFQGDQPFISPAAINSIIAEYLSSGMGIVIPLYKGRRGHPLLVDSKYFREIHKLDDNTGLRALPEMFKGDVHMFECSDEAILRDIDTFEEYIDELNKLK